MLIKLILLTEMFVLTWGTTQRCGPGQVPTKLENIDGELTLSCSPKTQCKPLRRSSERCMSGWHKQCSHNSWVAGIRRAPRRLRTGIRYKYLLRCCSHPALLANHDHYNFFLRDSTPTFDGLLSSSPLTLDIATSLHNESAVSGSQDYFIVGVTRIYCEEETTTSRRPTTTKRRTRRTKKPRVEEKKRKGKRNRGNEGSASASAAAAAAAAASRARGRGSSGKNKNSESNSEEEEEETEVEDTKLVGLGLREEDDNPWDVNSEEDVRGEIDAESVKALPVDSLHPKKAKPGEGCFTGSSTLQLLDQRIVAMENLREGDMVRTGPEHFAPIVRFLHKDPEEETDFITLSTSRGHSLTLSSKHLIPILPCKLFHSVWDQVEDVSAIVHEYSIFAERARLGDCLIGMDQLKDLYDNPKFTRETENCTPSHHVEYGGVSSPYRRDSCNDNIHFHWDDPPSSRNHSNSMSSGLTRGAVLERITNVKKEKLKGVYSPITSNGILIVDGIQVSCYSSVQHHNLQHAVFSVLNSVLRHIENFSALLKYFTTQNDVPLPFRTLETIFSLIVT